MKHEQKKQGEICVTGREITCAWHECKANNYYVWVSMIKWKTAIVVTAVNSIHNPPATTLPVYKQNNGQKSYQKSLCCLKTEKKGNQVWSSG